jgi:hypothetical protein
MMVELTINGLQIFEAEIPVLEHQQLAGAD